MNQNKTNVYWKACFIDNWNIYIAATTQGVCFVGSPNEPFSELEAWVQKNIPTFHLIPSDHKLQPVIDELQQYLHGKRQQFTVAKDVIGTDFQQAVWHACELIPYGETSTYSQIAEQIGRPKAVRAVGSAIGANPLLFIIPCHRMIAKNGSLAGFRAGIEVKEYLLTLENS